MISSSQSTSNSLTTATRKTYRKTKSPWWTWDLSKTLSWTTFTAGSVLTHSKLNLQLSSMVWKRSNTLTTPTPTIFWTNWSTQSQLDPSNCTRRRNSPTLQLFPPTKTPSRNPTRNLIRSRSHNPRAVRAHKRKNASLKSVMERVPHSQTNLDTTIISRFLIQCLCLKRPYSTKITTAFTTINSNKKLSPAKKNRQENQTSPFRSSYLIYFILKAMTAKSWLSGMKFREN